MSEANLLANKLAAFWAVDVNYGTPSTTSPKAYTFGKLVTSFIFLFVTILPFLLLTSSPTRSTLSDLVVALLPTANKTVSTFRSLWFLSIVFWTLTFSYPVSVSFSMLVGREVGITSTPLYSRSLIIMFTMSLSKLRRYSPLVISETLKPSSAKNPAISTAT